MRRVPVLAVAVPVAVVALALAGCGSSEEITPEANSSALQPVTVTDARNKQVRLPAPATKVVGLEWGIVESLVTVGVMPAGVADTKGYTTWVSAAKLDPSVKDVGTRREPSVDAIVALDPDLVVATTDTPAGTISQLEKAVPVLVVRGADARNPIPQMRANVELVASAVGRTEQARKVLTDFDQALADGKQKIAAAGKAGSTFTMADGYQQGSSITIRMFGTGSLLGAVGAELGLKNGWPGVGDKDYGLDPTDVEGLTGLKDGDFLYIASTTAGGDVFRGRLADNAIWKNLPFVRNDRVHRLPDGIWMFGGPSSTKQFIDATVQAVTS